MSQSHPPEAEIDEVGADPARDLSWVRTVLAQSGITVADADLGPIADIYREYERWMMLVDAADVAPAEPPAATLALSR